MRTRPSSLKSLALAVSLALLASLFPALPAGAGVGNLDNALRDSGINVTAEAAGAAPSRILASASGGGSDPLGGFASLFRSIFKSLEQILSQFFQGATVGGVPGGNPFAGNTPGGSSVGVTSGGTSGGAAEPPRTAAPPANARGGKALLGWLQAAGLSGEKLRMAWAIGMGESGGNPRAYNGNARTGDKSYGLFQINMIGSMGPARRRQFGISSNEQLFDPMTNIRAMMKISNNGTNWRPWSVYTRGTYRRFLSQYPPR